MIAAGGERPASFGLPGATVLLVLTGWAVLFGPIYWEAFDTIWKTEDQGHGPLVLVVCAWLFWQLKERLDSLPDHHQHVLGWPLVVLGLLAFLVGRTISLPFLVFGAQIPIAAGLLLLLKGWGAIRVAWFALLFLFFMTPLPGTLVDSSTQVLKQWISVIVSDLLHALGYPVSRTGVTITVGQYQLLVADACSGMHSMFSLTALGTLYMYIMRRGSRLHNAIMLAIILPTAFFANIVRVVILVLVTYYLGEEAGSGFLHGFAGLALLVVSLSVLFGVDAALVRLLPQSRRLASAAGAAS
jgi:exosortase B